MIQYKEQSIPGKMFKHEHVNEYMIVHPSKIIEEVHNASLK